MSLEIEINVKNTSFEGALESFLVRVLPFLVHDSESLEGNKLKINEIDVETYKTFKRLKNPQKKNPFKHLQCLHMEVQLET